MGRSQLLPTLPIRRGDKKNKNKNKNKKNIYIYIYIYIRHSRKLMQAVYLRSD